MIREEILVEHANLHNLDIAQLNIPLNKFVVVTGSSGSGKTSLIYDTIAKEAEYMFENSKTPVFRAVNDFTKTKITGLTPVKALKQKFSYFAQKYNYAQLLGIDHYLNLLFANFGLLNLEDESAIQGFSPREIYNDAKKLPPLSPELQAQRGFAYRYCFATPLHFQLLPTAIAITAEELLLDAGITEIEKADASQLAYFAHQVRQVNLNNINAALEFFKDLDHVIVNNTYVVDAYDLAEFVENLPDYELIHSLDAVFDALAKDHVIDANLLINIDKAVKREQGLFDALISANIVEQVAPKELCDIHGISLPKQQDELNRYTKATLNIIRRYFPASVKIYFPQDRFCDFYHLDSTVQIGDEIAVIDLRNPANFNRSFSPYRCKVCDGDGENCEACHQTGFNEVIHNLKLFGVPFKTLYNMTGRQFLAYVQAELQASLKEQVDEEQQSLHNLKLNLLSELQRRLTPLIEVGLGYLQLNRKANTLSGGEIQRTSLIQIITNNTCNVTYILDEPSIGLHPQDCASLLPKLRQLVQNGNSVLVIEHDPEFIVAADHLIILDQGKVVFEGTIEQLKKTDLPLARYLDRRTILSQQVSHLNLAEYKANINKERQGVEQDTLKHVLTNTQSGTANHDLLLLRLLKAAKQSGHTLCEYVSPHYPALEKAHQEATQIVYEGVKKNFFKNQTVEIKSGLLNVVAGISGSGKSTLANYVIAEASDWVVKNRDKLSREQINQQLQQVFKTDAIFGLEPYARVLYASQKPDNSGMDLLDYFGINKYIADIYAKAAARQTGKASLRADDFRLNSHSSEHKCFRCKGHRVIKIAKNSDESIACVECNGTGYALEVLAVQLQYDPHSKQAYNIAQFHNLNVNKAYDFLVKYHLKFPSKSVKDAIRRLAVLKRFRLGNLRLGASVDEFSGGEMQRLFLAKEINTDRLVSNENKDKMLLIIDEPTTGLHFDDIQSLLDLFVELKQLGHTIVVIEHNIDMIYVADHLIEIGPGADIDGGTVVFSGSISQLLKDAEKLPEAKQTAMMKLLSKYHAETQHYLELLQKNPPKQLADGTLVQQAQELEDTLKQQAEEAAAEEAALAEKRKKTRAARAAKSAELKESARSDAAKAKAGTKTTKKAKAADADATATQSAEAADATDATQAEATGAEAPKPKRSRKKAADKAAETAEPAAEAVAESAPAEVEPAKPKRGRKKATAES